MKFKAPIEVESSLVDSSNSSGSAGQVLTSTGVGVDWIDPALLPAESAEKVIQTVRFGEAVSKGDPLVITGYHGSTGPAIVERADATDATKMPAYGVALEDYANNATGLMIAVGDFNDFDTSSYSIGDTLYVAVGGGMTNVKPTGTALIQNMGIVSRSNANNGDVEIVAIGRTNDVPNLPTGRLFVGTATNTSLISDVVYVDDANDRVGIGTTSPSAKLDVTDTSAGNIVNNITVQNASNTAGTEAGVFFAPTTATGNIRGARITGIQEDGNNTIGLKFYTGFGAPPTEKMRITSTGNVGIGTTNPLAKLSIGTSTVWGTATNEVLTFDNLGSGGNTSNPHSLGRIKWNTNGAIGAAIDAIRDVPIDGNNIDLSFSTNLGADGTTLAERMRINYNGAIKFNNYGSGSFTGTATQRLAVDSSGNVIEIPIGGGAVDGSGTTNYVTKWTDADTIGNSQIFDNGTNVGIGTTSPSQKLTIGDGTGTGNQYVRINSSSADIYIGQQGSTLFGIAANSSQLIVGDNTSYPLVIGTTNSQPFIFGTTNAERMRITSSGNVGIGTTSPAYKLDVSSVSRFTGGFYLNEATAGTNGAVYLASDQTLELEAFGTNGAIAFSTGSSVLERMRITSGGNVGIGTNSPSNYSGYTTLSINNASSGGLIDLQNNGTSALRISADSTTQVSIYGATNVPMIFSTNSSERMRITSTGNVGIGTTNPSYKLDVTGSIRSSDGILNTDNCFEKILSTPFFTHGVANLAADIKLGNVSFWGYIEVEITGAYWNQNSAGRLSKLFAYLYE